jgi:hypothetical protein
MGVSTKTKTKKKPLSTANSRKLIYEDASSKSLKAIGAPSSAAESQDCDLEVVPPSLRHSHPRLRLCPAHSFHVMSHLQLYEIGFPSELFDLSPELIFPSPFLPSALCFLILAFPSPSADVFWKT